jgi:hypothetical protein
MHLFRLFLTAWLTFGAVTAFLLFWLCKRTAATVEGSHQFFSPQPAEVRTDNRDV